MYFICLMYVERKLVKCLVIFLSHASRLFLSVVMTYYNCVYVHAFCIIDLIFRSYALCSWFYCYPSWKTFFPSLWEFIEVCLTDNHFGIQPTLGHKYSNHWLASGCAATPCRIPRSQSCLFLFWNIMCPVVLLSAENPAAVLLLLKYSLRYETGSFMNFMIKSRHPWVPCFWNSSSVWWISLYFQRNNQVCSILNGICPVLHFLGLSSRLR